MKTSKEITKRGASTKRLTRWNGMQVGFSKERTTFFQVINLGPHDSNGGHTADTHTLTLSAFERAELLDAWREGKAKWYRENVNVPLRPNAERAKGAAISKTN